MKLYIFAMSKSKSEIQSMLENNAFELIAHLLKIYWFTNTGNLIHWKQELPGFVNKVYKLKSNNKYPKANWIYKILTYEYYPKFDKISYKVARSYIQLSPEDRNEGGDFKFVDDYITWLSAALSAEGNILPYDIYQEIDELIDKYKLKK